MDKKWFIIGFVIGFAVTSVFSVIDQSNTILEIAVETCESVAGVSSDSLMADCVYRVSGMIYE